MIGFSVFSKKKLGQKKPDQDLIFKTRSKSKKVLSCVLYHSATPNQILRSQERPPRLQEDPLETHKRLGTSKPAKAPKTDPDPPGCPQFPNHNNSTTLPMYP